MRNILLFIFSVLVIGQMPGQPVHTEKLSSVIFTGGRFWYLQAAFDETYGVVDTSAGYTGGSSANPAPVNYSGSGHLEAVKIVYHPDRVSFKELLDVYFRNIDPADSGGQFKERGKQFRTVIFWTEESQKLESLQYLDKLGRSGRFEKPIVTELEKAGAFYDAGKKEQHYSILNPALFKTNYARSGRENLMKGESTMNDQAKKYSKPGKQELKKKLDSEQYHVTQENGTEPAFKNTYWNNHEEGIYVDVVTGEPLFSSKDKYDSGTGWPSFIIPLVPGNVISETDTSYGMIRTEVRSRFGDSHLGHLFNDGPRPTGLRYCINSASLRFIPVKDLQQEGYGEFEKYFK